MTEIQSTRTTDLINTDEPFDEEMNEKRLGKDEFTSRQWMSLVFIVVTYITVIPNRTFIASISTTLKDDEDLDFDNETFGFIAIIAGFAYAFGKAVDGLLIDGRYCFSFMDEISSMLLFQAVSTASVFMFSFGDGPTWFILFLIPNSIVQAGIWPAMAKLIFEIYEPAQFGRVFAMLGVGSKIGSTFAKLYIGTLITLSDGDWRWTVRSVAGFGALGVIIFLVFVFIRLKDSDYVWFAFPYYSKLKEFFHIKTFDSTVSDFEAKQQSNNNNPDLQKKAQIASMVDKQLKCKKAKQFENLQNETEKEEIVNLKNQVLKEISEDIETETIYQKYTRILRNARFLLIAFATMCLTVLVGVEGFSDLLIDDVLDIETNGYVTMASSAMPAGIAVALIASNIIVGKYNPSPQASAKFVTRSLYALILVCLLMLAWIWIALSLEEPHEALFLILIGILLFALGAILAYPYYVPPQVFALRFGGKTDAGTVNALMDLVGFIAVAPFSYGGAALSEIDNGWGWVWTGLYVPIVFMCLYFYSKFLTYNLKSEKKQELLMKRIESEIDVLTKGFVEHQNTISVQRARTNSDVA